MSDALAAISPVKDLGMIQIRADLDRAGDAIAEAVGLAMPGKLAITGDGSRSIGWMSTDELLLILPAAEVAEARAALEQALAGEHALVLDVSDMRAVFDITGRAPDQVLRKLCPVDVATLPQDAFRRTRAAQVAAAFWRVPGGFRLVGMRSVTEYLRAILTNAAAPGTELDAR